MKKYLLVLSIIVFLSCEKDTVSDDSRITALERTLGVSVSDAPVDVEGLFFEGVSYGNGTRNQLDLLLPGTQDLKGLLIFFHGGAFVVGDKSAVFDDYLLPTISAILAEDIAVVSANYAFITLPESNGVLSSMEDGAAVISFIESLSTSLRLPANSILLSGGSAGAGIAQWNGFREASNGQVQGVLALEAQSSYNLYEWETVFPGFSLDDTREDYPVLEDLFLDFYAGEPTDELLQSLDYRSEMDGNDPPVYIYNQQSGQEVFNADGELDIDVLFHSFRHADYLRLKAIEVDQAFSGAYQESPADFIIRMLE